MNANVRTFRAPDPRAALAAVKAAFGEEAVIISTREISGGLWGKAEIEITAAATDESARSQSPGARPELDGEIAALRRVVEELRSELRSSRDEPRAADAIPPAVARLVRRLVKQGAEPAVAE